MYKKRNILNGLLYVVLNILPVPYIVEIPKSGNSRFEISPIGRLSPMNGKKES